MLTPLCRQQCQVLTNKVTYTQMGRYLKTTVLTNQNLSAASKVVVSATDVTAAFIYDTRNDTDGGAWRDRVVGASWMTETLNTETRGARAKFPSLALIVGRSSASVAPTITIYDLDDPACPMWMVFNAVVGGWLEGATTGGGVSTIWALNGFIYHGQNAASGRLGYDFHTWDFILDRASRNVGLLGTQIKTTNCLNRNAAGAWLGYVGTGIPSRTVNGVAATVAPNTPINSLRGLPNPVVGVATAGGMAFIRADGVCCNSSNSFSAAVAFHSGHIEGYAAGNSSTARIVSAQSPAWPVTFYLGSSLGLLGGICVGGTRDAQADSGRVNLYMRDTTNPVGSAVAFIERTINTGYIHGFGRIAFTESIRELSTINQFLAVENCETTANWTAAAGIVNGTLVASAGRLVYTSGANDTGGDRFRRTISGLTVGNVYCFDLSAAYAISGNNRLYINTMVLNGGTAAGKYFFTATATTINVTIWLATAGAGIVVSLPPFTLRAAVFERSWGRNHGICFGSVARREVAPGAELAMYSGFSAVNYIEVYNGGTGPNQYGAAGIAIGTGEFCATAAVVIGSSAVDRVVTVLNFASTDGTGAFWTLDTSVDGCPRFTISDGINSATATAGAPLTLNSVSFVRGIRRSVGSRIELWVNDELVAFASSSAIGSISNSSAVLRVGNNVAGVAPFDVSDGGIALVRLSTYANHGGTSELGTPPGRDHIAVMNTAERPLFAANAKCLLQGSSFGIQNIYQDETGLLYVAKSAGGTDRFDKLLNIGNLSGSSANHRAVRAAAGNVALVTTTGVEIILPAVPMRENLTSVPRAPVYDPVVASYTYYTFGATPTDLVNLPISEGKSYRVRAIVSAVQHGGVATERAHYTVEALAWRDLGGSVQVATTTTTISEVTATQDCVAIANTTAQTLAIRCTGRSGVKIVWTIRVEMIDAGLMTAA